MTLEDTAIVRAFLRAPGRATHAGEEQSTAGIQRSGDGRGAGGRGRNRPLLRLTQGQLRPADVDTALIGAAVATGVAVAMTFLFGLLTAKFLCGPILRVRRDAEALVNDDGEGEPIRIRGTDDL